MKRSLGSVFAMALLLCAAPAPAQQKATAQNVPEISYTSVPNFLKVPPGEYLGESVAVATNSKGHVFVYHSVRVDAQDRPLTASSRRPPAQTVPHRSTSSAARRTWALTRRAIFSSPTATATIAS